MHCPDCQILLRSVPANNAETCPSCAGEWIELPALAARLRQPGESTPSPGANTIPSQLAPTRRWRHCPICRAVLLPRPWPSAMPPVSLPTCSLGHGAWLTPAMMQTLQEASRRACHTLLDRAAYFRFLARAARQRFERAMRPRRKRHSSPLARLLGPWL